MIISITNHIDDIIADEGLGEGFIYCNGKCYWGQIKSKDNCDDNQELICPLVMTSTTMIAKNYLSGFMQTL